jgi:D-beta-D-heptose 7-phosphate kinase/D-beta-D-heptose 1-phosphate adenosyltransferase
VSSQLTELLSQSRRPKILVVGDAMLDRYLWGDVDRISPEAPIPVLSVVMQEERLGGAASVVSILAALEADVALATVTADDADGRKIRDLLQQHGAHRDCTLVAADRRTTVKERLLGRTQSRHPQQVIRVDRDHVEAIDSALAGKLLRAIEGRLDEVEILLVSDYGKGVCSDLFVAELARLARRAGVPVVADPARNVDFCLYSGCTCITPNRTEAGAALDMRIDTPEKGLEAARRLLSFDLESAVVTLDRDGIAWADAKDRSQLFPVRPRQVYDITGAGDMVLATLGYSLAAGADWPAAIELANLAGGLEVERLGVAPLTRQELLAELSSAAFASQRKIVSLERLDEQLRDRRRAGQRIVMTNGCFDLLHPGHVASLQHARGQGDCLVVAVNSDQSVERLKGEGRPIIREKDRAAMLAALGCVDYVLIFDDVSVAGFVQRVSPDILVKSDEYSPEEVVGHEIIQRQGGKVVLAPQREDYSTSSLIGKIQRLAKQEAPEDE